MSRISMIVAPQVAQLGRDALDRVRNAAAEGAPLVQCQLLASEFYEALRRELDETPWWDGAKRGRLAAVLDQCGRAAGPRISSEAMLIELEVALSLLTPDPTPVAGPVVAAAALPPPAKPGRPVLRLIKGGLD